MAEAVIFCLENWDPFDNKAPLDIKNKPLFFLNVGTGKDISIKDLSIMIANQTGFKGNIVWDTSKPDGTPRKKLNVDKINQLGWHAQISLEEGIRKTIMEYKKISLK